jgi:hypothetical protein
VLRQLPLDIVGEAPAVGGDEAPSLLLGAVLLPPFDSRKDAPQEALLRAGGRSLRSTRLSAVHVEASVERSSSHGLTFHC